jgi:hypothetical protein
MVMRKVGGWVVIRAITVVGLCIPCMAQDHVDLTAVVHHEGVQYVIEKLSPNGGATAKWLATEVASAARKEVNIPADLSGVVIVEGDCAYYLDKQKLFKMSLRGGAAKVVVQPFSGFLQDAYSYAGGYVVLMTDSSGWHYLRNDGAGKNVASIDIPVIGNLRATTIQGGILIMSFAGENGIGTNILKIDLATNKLLAHSDRICTLKDLGVELWLSHILVRHAGASFLCPFDSPFQYFKRYKQDYILCTLQRLVCVSSEKHALLSAKDAQDWTFDGDVVLTTRGPVAIEPSGKIIYDLFSQPEQ